MKKILLLLLFLITINKVFAGYETSGDITANAYYGDGSHLTDISSGTFSLLTQKLTISDDNQTEFSLSASPNSIQDLLINGITYCDTESDFTVSGDTLTWVNTDYSLKTTDSMYFRYNATGFLTEKLTVSTENQTEFTLIATPSHFQDIVINGIIYCGATIDYTITGDIIVWINSDVDIKIGDSIYARYYY